MYNYMKINYFKNKSHDILTANELNASMFCRILISFVNNCG